MLHFNLLLLFSGLTKAALLCEAKLTPVTFLSKDTERKKVSVCFGCVSLRSMPCVDRCTRGPPPEHVNICCVRVFARSPAAVNSQLCCLCQREKGKLCLCRVVVQEGVE